MKKTAFCILVFLFLLGIAACSGKEKSIDIKDVKVSTLLARSNGEIQVASVEDFDKSYYNLKELQDFVDQQVTSYNSEAGAGMVTVDDVEIRNNKAILLLTYAGMDQYCAFNKVTAAYFVGGVKSITLTLPTTLITAGNEELASTEEVIADTNYRILILNEPYNIMVDGKVRYYSENATLIDKNEAQSAAEGMTIVVFKP
jgi:hypothetical protein